MTWLRLCPSVKHASTQCCLARNAKKPQKKHFFDNNTGHYKVNIHSFFALLFLTINLNLHYVVVKSVYEVQWKTKKYVELNRNFKKKKHHNQNYFVLTLKFCFLFWLSIRSIVLFDFLKFVDLFKLSDSVAYFFFLYRWKLVYLITKL